MILGDGERVWASANEHRDLFFTAAGSCGSLGVITLLEMELIEAKSYVELQYIPVKSTQEAVQQLRKYENEAGVDYMDGIMYSMTSGVIMIGRLTNDTIPGRIHRFDRPHDPWCYMHAEEIMKKVENSKADHRETILVQSYLFRYDRGVFWSGLRAFKYFATPFSKCINITARETNTDLVPTPLADRLTRYLLDPFMYSRTMVHALHRSGIASRTIIQDYGVPYDAAEEFVRWTDEQTGIWPLWLCPVKPAPQGERGFSQGNNIKDEILLDVGIWDMGPVDAHAFIKLNRAFEAKVTELGGMKCLYAHAYYTEQEFWDIYDEKMYMKLRNEYHAENLPSVYDKVKVDLQGVAGGRSDKRGESWSEWAYNSFWNIWPLGGLYGVASATKGMLVESDFLLKK
jgi:delta24-sterol reductase